MPDELFDTSHFYNFNMIKLYTHKRIQSNIFLEIVSEGAYNGTKMCCAGYIAGQRVKGSYSKYKISEDIWQSG